MMRDQQRSGFVSCQDFLTCFELSGMNVLPREFEELQGELDPQKSGRINYELFLTSVFMTQMFLKELNLTTVLRQMDTENKGGITIR
jgi:Ca2+-binding EF-hand superfamily protein